MNQPIKRIFIILSDVKHDGFNSFFLTKKELKFGERVKINRNYPLPPSVELERCRNDRSSAAAAVGPSTFTCIECEWPNENEMF